MQIRLSLLVLVAGLLGLGACSESREPMEQGQKVLSKESSIEVARPMAQQESDRIDAYVKRHNWSVTETGTGLRYMIYQNGDGPQAKSEMLAGVYYTVRLLTGEECYSNLDGDVSKFRIGRDNVESGLHEGIQLMRVGDKARMILPPHLAFGLTGDQNKIPPHATVVYDIELVSLE